MTIDNLREIAFASARGESHERLMALSGFGDHTLRAIMSCDLFKGLVREEKARLDGQV